MGPRLFKLRYGCPNTQRAIAADPTEGMVATGLHHHRFLERPIVRVPITTLWQIGYTVKKCPPFGRPTLTSATKREQYSTAPERARIGWGKSHAGSGSLGDGPYSARGRCRSDTFTYANSQSGNVGKPKATRSLDPIPAVLLHGSACLLWVEDRDRGTPRSATPPTPPGIRVAYHGGSTGLSWDRNMESGKTE